MILGLPVVLSRSCPLHQHEVHELIVCVNDGANTITKDNTYPFKKAKTFLIPQGLKHGFTLEKKGAKAYLFCFNQSFATHHLPAALHVPLEEMLAHQATVSNPGVNWEYAITLADRLSCLLAEKGPFFEEKAGALLSQLLIEHLQNACNFFGAGAKQNQNDWEELLFWLTENLCEKISINTAAKQLGVSRAVFTRLFRQKTGMSFTEFLASKRIDLAAELLGNSDQSITDIAFNSGYQNMGHFFKQFQQRFNMTPNSYRKMLKNQLLPT